MAFFMKRKFFMLFLITCNAVFAQQIEIGPLFTKLSGKASEPVLVYSRPETDKIVSWNKYLFGLRLQYKPANGKQVLLGLQVGYSPCSSIQTVRHSDFLSFPDVEKKLSFFLIEPSIYYTSKLVHTLSLKLSGSVGMFDARLVSVFYRNLSPTASFIEEKKSMKKITAGVTTELLTQPLHFLNMGLGVTYRFLMPRYHIIRARDDFGKIYYADVTLNSLQPYVSISAIF